MNEPSSPLPQCWDTNTTSLQFAQWETQTLALYTATIQANPAKLCAA